MYILVERTENKYTSRRIKADDDGFSRKKYNREVRRGKPGMGDGVLK